jgi:hypothetical protein
MKFARTSILAASAALTLSSAPARAADYNAEVAFRMFASTCVRRLAMAGDIMAWAKEARLTPIQDASLLATFVGHATGGPKGGAWLLPSPNDRKFTLSIRSGTQTCALWAETGDPGAAEELFKKLVNDASRPGTNVATEQDQKFTTATGKSRLLEMTVTEESGEGYKFTFMGGDQPGSFFAGAPVQLSMQMTRLPADKNAKQQDPKTAAPEKPAAKQKK